MKKLKVKKIDVIVYDNCLYMFYNNVFSYKDNTHNYKKGQYQLSDNRLINKLLNNKKIDIEKYRCSKNTTLYNVIEQFKNYKIAYNLKKEYIKEIKRIKISKDYIYSFFDDFVLFLNK